MMLKLREGFILREVAGETVVIPSGDELDLNMMITLNETGRFLWERIAQGIEEADLVAALLAEYVVDEATAKAAVARFAAQLRDKGFLI